jgi:predicted anti-sigma-YlaC factor YlaD
MGCHDIREAISAQLDNELNDEPAAGARIDAHLATCEACRAFAARAADLHRIVRVRAAERVPDLSAAIVAAAPQPAARRRPAGHTWGFARTALAVVALTHLILALPAVLLGSDPGATIHVARELGSFDVALAVGLLVAAWQPARAWGLLPLAAALAAVMVGTAALDIARGSAPAASEAHHVLELAGVGLLWLVAREVPRSSARLRTA